MSASIEDRALELIKSKPKGILQSELWKDLEIDSRKCSRVVAKLEAEGKVKRTWETVSGTRTYRLGFVQQKKEAPKKEYRFDLILAEEEVAPCVGCTYECEPDYCPDLGLWIELLAKEEIRKPTKNALKKIGAKAIEEPEAPEEVEAPKAAKAGKAAKKGKPVKVVEEEPEEEPEEVKPAKPAKKGKAAKAKKIEEDEDEDEEDEEEEPVDEDEEEEEFRPSARRGKSAKESKPAPKAPAKKVEKKPPAKKRK
ncbi:MAG: transcription factor TFIIIC [Methanocella sp.]